MIGRLVLAWPGLVISGWRSHRMVIVVVYLRIGRGDVRDVRLLGLWPPRRGPIRIRLRILSCILVRRIILPGISRRRGNVVLIPLNDRVKLILPVAGRRSARMQGEDRGADE